MSTGYVLVDVSQETSIPCTSRPRTSFVSDVRYCWDLTVLKIEADSMGEIAKLVVDSVRSIEGVTNTKTLACAEL